MAPLTPCVITYIVDGLNLVKNDIISDSNEPLSFS